MKFDNKLDIIFLGLLAEESKSIIGITSLGSKWGGGGGDTHRNYLWHATDKTNLILWIYGTACKQIQVSMLKITSSFGVKQSYVVHDGDTLQNLNFKCCNFVCMCVWMFPQTCSSKWRIYSRLEQKLYVHVAIPVCAMSGGVRVWGHTCDKFVPSELVMLTASSDGSWHGRGHRGQVEMDPLPLG